ncbi:uncharacterized protein TM35_000031580 [Trypanosoma theileri]|uniref:Mucin TcMUCII n=1 Tax=Trypanosoma theileri TaxID=67003 RepID=A0A1X0P6A5_9TRYP|nr:uncharacterized protein TM35_000031580 [Trypanosoma theileri]ORC92405.1 hypothetical protein TM35_000031580 [Trypanosoma theileri]
MAKAVMLRCNLLCLLTLLLCCDCGLVWGEQSESTMEGNGKVVVCVPPSEEIRLDNGTLTCCVPKVVKTQEPHETHAVVRQQEGQQMEENKPRDAETDTGRESHPDTHQPTNGENTNSTGSSANEGKETSDNALPITPETSSNTSPSQNAGESGAAETGPTSNPNDAENANTTTTTTNTTTTTLPPELTNNKKGDADSSSSISSSVWVRVPLLIVVTLACILVC